jgi:uncharacterized protein
VDTRITPFADDLAEPAVRGFLHEPLTPTGELLVLTHGAGSNAQARLLVEVATAFAEDGFTVLRVDLPFRQLRPHGPPRPGDAAHDREGLRRAAEVASRLTGTSRPEGARRLYLGGHSYGGRQATMLAAEDPSVADELLLLSYPLHPPRQPSNLRTGHFQRLTTPALFVHGSRDPFGSLEEMRAALQLIPVAASLLPVEGAGHDLVVGRKTQTTGLPQAVLAAFRAFLKRMQEPAGSAADQHR